MPDGRRAVPVFQLVAERYLDPHYAPDAVAAALRRAGGDASGGSPPSSAQAAFEQEIVLQQPWTDWAGRRHETMVGRPVAMHAMRGISAHSNGFHTCRALHVLQMLLGAHRYAGVVALQVAVPAAARRRVRSRRARSVAAGQPLGGMPLGYPTGPEDLLVERGRHAAAHRQGVFVGGAARPPTG